MKEYNEFKKFCTDAESKNISLDFDGVIHKNSKGFYDGTIYDEPIEGALENIKYLNHELNYTLIIHTCKANPKRPLINGKTGSRLIYEWLVKYDLDSYIYNIVY